jgi:hypothetical protein
VWGFHYSFTDRGSHTAWRTLVGAITVHSTSSGLREPIEGTATRLVSRLDAHGQTALASLQSSLHPCLELAARRERALAETIELERARLSAALLQRGLFDRRAERQAAAQSVILDEALQKCRTCLSEIVAASQIVAEPAQLAFVLIRR